MSEFLSIEESKQKFVDGVSKNTSFIATVVVAGDLKSGTKDNNDWSNKKFTLDDGKTREEIIAWNDDIKKLKVGYKYEFNSPYWTEYKEVPQLTLGQYCEVKCIGSSEKQETLENQPETSDLPNIDAAIKEFTLKEHKILQDIAKVVKAECRKEFGGSEEPRGDIVWVRVAEIYKKWPEGVR